MVLEIDTTRRRKTITKEVLQEGKDCHAADNIYKNVDAAKMRNDLIDYFRASLRRTEVCLNKYIYFSNELLRRENKGLSQSSKDGFKPVSLMNDNKWSKELKLSSEGWEDLPKRFVVVNGPLM